MSHDHKGPAMEVRPCCYAEIRGDIRRERFWRWVLIVFGLSVAAVAAFVLCKIGVGK